MRKKGQAALEFLMTYGWAILVVMVVIGALAYFGVLNPMIFVPDRCSMPSGFNCVTSVIDEGSARVLIDNGLGQSIMVTGVKFTYPRTEDVFCEAKFDRVLGKALPIEIVSGRQETVEAVCEDAFSSIEGRKLSFDIELTYYLESAGREFTTKAEGQVVTTVLSGSTPAVGYNYFDLSDGNGNCTDVCGAGATAIEIPTVNCNLFKSLNRTWSVQRECVNENGEDWAPAINTSHFITTTSTNSNLTASQNDHRRLCYCELN